MKGSMMDMYRQPDNLIKACNTILEQTYFPGDTGG